MTISDIIQSRYRDLSKLLKNTDTLVICGLTYDDLFHQVLITQLKKYEEKDIDPDEGYEILKKAVLTEFLFIPKKKGRDVVVLAGDYFMKPKEMSDATRR